MAINYDFIAYCIKTSPTNWIIGMKSMSGEVPLDIVVPHDHVPTDPENPEIVGVLTADGLERESSDELELYRYLRQLNPKKNEAFGYNEVVIRNIHSRLRGLQVGEELLVQITYTERKEPYTQFAYQIKLLGTYQHSDAELANHAESGVATDVSEENTQPQEQVETNQDLEQSVYKTTNTLEKLIGFAQNLQQELRQTKRDLAATVERIERFENEWQNFREMQELIQDILDRLTRLETMDSRIQYLEVDRHQLQDLQQFLRKFLLVLNQQTGNLLQEQDDNAST